MPKLIFSFEIERCSPLEVIDYIAKHDAWRVSQNKHMKTSEQTEKEGPQ